MPSQDSIDVRIIVDGKPLKEYEDQNVNLDDERLRTRYVEVKVGQKFGVRVKLLQGFELKYTKEIFCSLQIDNHDDERQCFGQDTSHMKNRRGQLQQDYTLRECWTGHTTWDESHGEWMEMDWEFGALGTSKNEYRVSLS